MIVSIVNHMNQKALISNFFTFFSSVQSQGKKPFSLPWNQQDHEPSEGKLKVTHFHFFFIRAARAVRPKGKIILAN